MDLCLTTNRLLIRPFTLCDAPFILELLNEPAFIKHIADKGVRDLAAACDYLRQGPLASYQTFGFGLWCVCLQQPQIPIGMAGLLQRDFLPAADIGYALLSRYSGVGLALEMTTAVVHYAQHVLGLNPLLAIVNDDNLASIRLLGKLGFLPAGRVNMPGKTDTLPLYQLVLDTSVSTVSNQAASFPSV